MKIDNIFETRKLNKNEKKEKKLRELERMQSKVEIARINEFYKNRQIKYEMLKRIEKNKSFQKDLNKMKKILYGGR